MTVNSCKLLEARINDKDIFKISHSSPTMDKQKTQYA